MNIRLRTKMLLLSFIIVFASIGTSGLMMVYSISDVLERELGERAMAIARTVAQMPNIKNHVGKENGAEVIQPIAERTRVATSVDYIVVFDLNRIRYSHPSEELIGKEFEGGDEKASLAEHEYISKAKGALGYSVRAFVPIMDEEGVHQVGVSVVGILTPTFQSLLADYRNDILVSLVWGLLIGLAGSLVLAHNIKRQTLNLEPYEIAKMVQERSAVMQAMDMGIITIDEENNVTFMNRLAREYSHITEKKDLKKQLHLSDILPDSWKTVVNLLNDGNLQNLNRSIVVYEKTYLVSIYNFKIKGKFAGSLITMTDKTEANRLAEELTGVKTLVDALRAQNHEYMNKLHSIAGLIQLNRTEEALDVIIDETTNEESTIQFLKDSIKDHAVSGLLLGKKSRARELNIQFTINRSSFLECTVNGLSSGDIVTILGNLIENAFEAYAPQDPQKTVECTIQGNAQYLFIDVKDEAKGIPLEVQSEIFTYGFSTKSREGRGIGLALVKQIVDSHGGEIEVLSEVGKGTEIKININRGVENDKSIYC